MSTTPIVPTTPFVRISKELGVVWTDFAIPQADPNCIDLDLQRSAPALATGECVPISAVLS
eukprot:623653-Rhodomonas_salina.1